MDALQRYLDQLQVELGPAVVKAVTGVIDKESENVYSIIRTRTPVSSKDHVHLIDTLQKIPVDSFGKYGWRISFEGYNEHGVPYSLIARALNKGNAIAPGIHHMDYAFSTLKGMDDRIADAVQESLNKIK